jgi:hypothetical protein
LLAVDRCGESTSGHPKDAFEQRNAVYVMALFMPGYCGGAVFLFELLLKVVLEAVESRVRFVSEHDEGCEADFDLGISEKFRLRFFIRPSD